MHSDRRTIPNLHTKISEHFYAVSTAQDHDINVQPMYAIRTAYVYTKKYNISTNLIHVIKNLYNKTTSAVLFNSSIGGWFRTTVAVRQGCLLSPTLFNIFLERIMTDALENHEGTVSFGGRTITNKWQRMVVTSTTPPPDLLP